MTMRARGLIWLALMLAPVSARAMPSEEPPDDQQASTDDCMAALAQAKGLIGQPSFAGLPEATKLAAYTAGATCAIGMRDYDLADSWLMQGTRLPGATPELWRMRFLVELTTKRNSEAVTTV